MVQKIRRRAYLAATATLLTAGPTLLLASSKKAPVAPPATKTLPDGNWELKSFAAVGEPDPAKIKKCQEEVDAIKRFMAIARLTPEGLKIQQAKLAKAERKLAEAKKGLTHTAVLADTTITIKFDAAKNRVSGSTAVNSYGGTAKLLKSKLSFGPMMSTQRARLDPKGVMQQESRYLKQLAHCTKLTATKTQLILEDAKGNGLHFAKKP